jgi:hypothetical protein
MALGLNPEQFISTESLSSDEWQVAKMSGALQKAGFLAQRLDDVERKRRAIVAARQSELADVEDALRNNPDLATRLPEEQRSSADLHSIFEKILYNVPQ